MYWMIPALLAPFLSAIVNFIDKYLATRQIKNCLAMQLYTSTVGFCYGTLVWAWLGFPFLGGLNVLWALGVGLLFSVAGVGYFIVLSRKDVSDMIFLLNLTPVFVLMLAFLFLGEAISYGQFFGFWLVLAAVLLVSMRKNANIPLFSFTTLLILGMDVLLALAAVMSKIALNSNSFAAVLIYDGWGLGFGGILIYIFSSKVRNAFWENFKTTPAKAFGIVGISETLTVLAAWTAFFAYSIGPVALVSAVDGIRSFYAIILGLLLTLFMPSLVREDIAGDTLFRKILAAVILTAGLYFVSSPG